MPGDPEKVAWPCPLERRNARTSGQNSVVVFAWFVAFLVLVAAYGSDRGGWVDELGLQNPPYMLAHFGKLTFPAVHGQLVLRPAGD